MTVDKRKKKKTKKCATRLVLLSENIGKGLICMAGYTDT